jgi:hypothetical protein
LYQKTVEEYRENDIEFDIHWVSDAKVLTWYDLSAQSFDCLALDSTLASEHVIQDPCT